MAALSINTEVEKLLDRLPAEIVYTIKTTFEENLHEICEIKINLNCPLIVIGKREYVFDSLIITKDILNKCISRLTNNSLFTYEKNILQGYFTVDGGHRIGVAGKFTFENGNKQGFVSSISGLNIRVAKTVRIESEKILKSIMKDSLDSIYNTLIISPPGCGKTTLLRNIIRILSSGEGILAGKGFRVVVIDERSEICPKNNDRREIGIRTFVLDGVDKLRGILMAVRSLNPQIIAMDELGSPSDYLAVCEASKMGVRIIATMHAESIKDIYMREFSRKIINQGVFEKVIVLSSRNGPGTIEKILSLGEGKNGG
ncbi:AAA ATPase [Caldicellulosiruptor kronotskyensis 2002]|uniref:AAA ATPase n=1 Tax=Caldicellulosiruptor kronotskyensis (strain DSM 18902 / VKM B-2412 / 2002) TaxID=632348 RepID=E4SFL8_CALK2|nr:AAA family ATPase [Caldicellulosiruptor kronotskyensis]ADQ46543.1 AAA ATPase [Caldicellulosiruptor kronotskyensis 2002]